MARLLLSPTLQPLILPMVVPLLSTLKVGSLTLIRPMAAELASAPQLLLKNWMSLVMLLSLVILPSMAVYKVFKVRQIKHSPSAARAQELSLLNQITEA